MFQSGARNREEPTRFGRIFKPDEAWHAKAPAEPILEPELAIVDTHHHLWDFQASATCSTSCWPT
jgi:hypothetical protein